MKQTLIAAAISATTLNATVQAQSTDSATSALQVIRIIGSAQEVQQLAGSGAVIDPRQLEIEANTDINQLLKTVPGLYVREEDGEGLRPNIGVRAAAGGRTSKVTLLEDGVMIAPAPYSNPAAYYFPEAYRMNSIEILKGAPLLRYGPQTTGGVINLVTPSIPADNGGRVTVKAGEHNAQDIHAWYGGTSGDFGWLVDTVQRSSDGFKHIDRSNRDAGYEIQDYMVKLGWTGERQQLLAKLQYSEQVSNETYAGLTDEDFAADPNRRYGLSEIDQMDNHHAGLSLTYSADLTDRVSLTVLGYENSFARDWFKTSLGSLINAANSGDVDAQAVLDGERDIEGMEYKHNNRAYTSRGVEINTRIDLDAHQLEVGVRDHSDEMDRFQPVEVYDQINGSLVFRDVIQPTGGNNRLEGADARSLWLTDEWQATEALRVNLALRYEDVDTFREQFSVTDRGQPGSFRSSESREWLPGASFTYDLNPEWQVLAGVHRGFAPLGGGATDNQEPETSINYEAGVRMNREQLFVEAVAFRSDFDNQSENCSVASPCSNGATSGSFVTSEAVVNGLELQARNTWQFDNGWRLPAQLSYTYTDAAISKDNQATGVMDGDVLADIPENLFSLRLGLESGMGWDNHLVAKYMDTTCVSTGCNRDDDRFGETESLFVTDLISRYSLNEQATVFLRVENLFDEQVIIGRAPHGGRPNKPRTASIGFQYDL
ncbi:MAG: TonB-dependent receptor family protein [Pseudomonadota bacterium]